MIEKRSPLDLFSYPLRELISKASIICLILTYSLSTLILSGTKITINIEGDEGEVIYISWCPDFSPSLIFLRSANGCCLSILSLTQRSHDLVIVVIKTEPSAFHPYIFLPLFLFIAFLALLLPTLKREYLLPSLPLQAALPLFTPRNIFFPW